MNDEGVFRFGLIHATKWEMYDERSLCFWLLYITAIVARAAHHI